MRHNSKHINWRRFDSPEEYADYCERLPRSICYYNDTNRPSKDEFGGVDIPIACKYLRNGCTENLDEARKIMDQMGNENLFSMSVPMLRADVQGIIPNVPGLLAGHPQGMFARHIEETPALNAPLTVYFEASVSAGIDHDTLVRRGVAALAFVLAMEVIRPVDLYITCLWSHSQRAGVYGSVVRVPSRPMDLGRATYMMTDPSFYRRLAFSAVNDMSGTNSTKCSKPWVMDSGPTNKNYIPYMRELLDMQPDDIFIKGGYLLDRNMTDNPVQWVKDMIAQHGGNKDE